MADTSPTVAILGASGLLGYAIALSLSQDGFKVVPIARRFAAHQINAFGVAPIECPIVNLDPISIARLLREQQVDLVINCLGVLQDSGRGRADEVHSELVSRLLLAITNSEKPAFLVHFSIPGRAEDDRTPFSRTKRVAERAIRESLLSFVILRPGFVIAPNAYGGSALIRALSALPFALPTSLAGRPFAVIDLADILRTIKFIAHRWQCSEGRLAVTWDVMARDNLNVGDVIDRFRRHMGGPRPSLTLPSWLFELGAWAGDILALFGWMPPVRNAPWG